MIEESVPMPGQERFVPSHAPALAAGENKAAYIRLMQLSWR